MLGLDYLLSSPSRAGPNLISTTSTSLSTSLYASTSLVESSSVSPPSAFAELESGYPALAQQLSKLPSFSSNSLAAQRISTLALQADNPQVKEAFDLMLLGGKNNDLQTQYSVPNWNTELQALYWLADNFGVALRNVGEVQLATLRIEQQHRHPLGPQDPRGTGRLQRESAHGARFGLRMRRRARRASERSRPRPGLSSAS